MANPHFGAWSDEDGRDDDLTDRRRGRVSCWCDLYDKDEADKRQPLKRIKKQWTGEAIDTGTLPPMGRENDTA